MREQLAPQDVYRSVLSALQCVKDADGKPMDSTDARRIAWRVFETINESGYVVVKQDRLGRLVAAADKLRRFSRSIVGYGGRVPESEALTDDDLVGVAS